MIIIQRLQDKFNFSHICKLLNIKNILHRFIRNSVYDFYTKNLFSFENIDRRRKNYVE